MLWRWVTLVSFAIFVGVFGGSFGFQVAIDFINMCTELNFLKDNDRELKD